MTDDLDTTYRIPRPGVPCVCGAIVLAGELPARFVTADSCRACGMAARWQRRAPIRYRTTHVCGFIVEASSAADVRAHLAEHAAECLDTPLARMVTTPDGLVVDVRARRDWIEAGVYEP